MMDGEVWSELVRSAKANLQGVAQDRAVLDEFLRNCSPRARRLLAAEFGVRSCDALGRCDACPWCDALLDAFSAQPDLFENALLAAFVVRGHSREAIHDVARLAFDVVEFLSFIDDDGKADTMAMVLALYRRDPGFARLIALLDQRERTFHAYSAPRPLAERFDPTMKAVQAALDRLRTTDSASSWRCATIAPMDDGATRIVLRRDASKNVGVANPSSDHDWLVFDATSSGFYLEAASTRPRVTTELVSVVLSAGFGAEVGAVFDPPVTSALQLANLVTVAALKELGLALARYHFRSLRHPSRNGFDVDERETASVMLAAQSIDPDAFAPERMDFVHDFVLRGLGVALRCIPVEAPAGYVLLSEVVEGTYASAESLVALLASRLRIFVVVAERRRAA